VSAAPLRITVTDANGRPVPEASVTVVESSVPFPEIGLLSDEQGVLQLSLPAGRFTFRAHGPGDTSGTGTVDSDATGPLRLDIAVN
jgi:hypothetical protein